MSVNLPRSGFVRVETSSSLCPDWCRDFEATGVSRSCMSGAQIRNSLVEVYIDCLIKSKDDFLCD